MADARPTMLERAFEIARSGKATDCHDIEKQLAREGYGSAALAGEGRILRKQVGDLCKSAKRD
ncbi:MAG TPA: hypothetical protein VGF97_05365 [Rhizomicrobium sp.]